MKSNIVGLRMTHEVGAKNLLAFSDSLLVNNQVNGTYEAKDQRIQRYLDATR